MRSIGTIVTRPVSGRYSPIADILICGPHLESPADTQNSTQLARSSRQHRDRLHRQTSTNESLLNENLSNDGFNNTALRATQNATCRSTHPIRRSARTDERKRQKLKDESVAYPRVGGLKTVEQFQNQLHQLGLNLPCDEQRLSTAENSPLAKPLQLGDRKIANRWCIHPMEGWDGTVDGQPSELTERRWKNFGLSGASLIWGGEAVAVRHDGRANPNQLCHQRGNEHCFEQLLEALKNAHRESFGHLEGLYTGLQLTHSGRFSRPNEKSRAEPRVAYRHPILDRRVGVDSDKHVFTDGELRNIQGCYVAAAKTADNAGYDFVDIKACHGYLLHEFLSAYDRPGVYGGDLDGRSKLLTDIIAAVRSECPNLEIGVRLSVFDRPPYRPEGYVDGKLGPGVPEDWSGAYPAFGCDRTNPIVADLSEPIELISKLRDQHGVKLWNLTAGSPYYNPHIQRPAFYPPSDGYAPPEDPLIGCVRQLEAVRDVKAAVDDVIVIGSAYTYFQEYLPHVAQAVVRDGWVDMVGLGRMVLSDWTLPADVLAGSETKTKRVCRTFSDCTTAPRNGIISGCYPLDPEYKTRDEAKQLKAVKAAQRKAATKP